jgi:hypothetical protein
VVGKRRSFAEASHWNGPVLWADHAIIRAGDLDQVPDVERLALWNVVVEPGVLAALNSLWWLDIRGGSTASMPPVEEATGLRYLNVNQVRGLSDLSWLSGLRELELLDLYGLPQVGELPSLRDHARLRRIEIGSMKGLRGIAGLLDAPALRELCFSRAVALTEADGIDAHPTLREFFWFPEDVPDRVWEPIVDRLNRDRPRARSCHPEEWFAAQKH